MRSTDELSASCITLFVRSLVSKIFLIILDLVGSTKSPTLSHDSAKERGASRLNSSTTELRVKLDMAVVL